MSNASQQTKKKKPVKKRTPAKAQKRKRLSPKEREELIVDVAIEFFAEHGFEGTTRQLADRLGITQPLLFRYFPTKQALVERVYEEIYVSRWNSEWNKLLKDRSQPLNKRLISFYQQYANNVYNYAWIRTFIYSGLTGNGINDRYLSFIEKQLLVPICTEMRHENGLPTVRKVRISEEELELAWGMHAMFVNKAIRRFVYGIAMVKDIEKSIENDVQLFIKGAPAVQKKIIRQAIK
ncbi:MAG: TetR/AcrR family transcriptional regulator [Hyphomicrobiaceae bacterium]